MGLSEKQTSSCRSNSLLVASNFVSSHVRVGTTKDLLYALYALDKHLVASSARCVTAVSTSWESLRVLPSKSWELCTKSSREVLLSKISAWCCFILRRSLLRGCSCSLTSTDCCFCGARFSLHNVRCVLRTAKVLFVSPRAG